MRTLFLILLLFPLIAWAGPEDELLAQLASIDTLAGRFVQAQSAGEGVATVSSSGEFQLLKGGYFSWAIETPDRQLILATPEYLWHHDLDLETVTRRPVGATDEMSPLQVLGGDMAYLRSHYRIDSAGPGTYTLVPKDIDPGFQSLTLDFEGGQIAAMSIVDKLGQQIAIQFSQLDNPALTKADFDFQPPPGVDLFYYDE